MPVDALPKNLRGRDVPAFSVDPDDLVLVTDRRHPLFREEVLRPIDEKMVASIMLRGVISPVVARRDGPRLEVVDGRQRTKNAREANKRLRAEGRPPVKIKVLLWNGIDKDVVGAAAAANEHRHPADVLIKAAHAQRSMHFGSTIADVATDYGVTTQTIENWLRLNDLHRDVRAYVARGELRYTVAMRLASLPREEQVPKLREILRARATNANAVRAVNGGKLEKVVPPTRQHLRRIADAFLRTENFLSTDRASDVFSFVSWVLGRISTEELLSNLTSKDASAIGEVVRQVMNGRCR
jgi:ParB family chromosome partitioning protein